MGRGAVFFAGMTKAQLRACIRLRLKERELEVAFQDELISDLIAEKHYYCAVHDLRPSQFRMLNRPGGGYDFYGLFDSNRWHKVSWSQCLDPRDQNDWIQSALRLATAPFLTARRRAFPICERCGISPSTEVDHVNPEFRAIVHQAMQLMTTSEFHKAFRGFDWWSENPFILPADNPALAFTLKAHQSATLQAVCKDCHLQNAADRKPMRVGSE
ncbi:hypothetical protein EDF87_12554 [Pseudomonas helmanticensis]|uniref:Uncharacterized protein n=1 Tax=Pseudomonas helmanticensis TaxID=1471381 RepID=A0A4R7UR68_9PSED|nr:hypothetical protein [Pseudomonas helmanticensis]TDV37518.1 hypothetical protein EDF87_12554 [Pseudomonas helmanticensis]